MAVNPMQRKANNSFLLGMLITMLITGAIIAFLLMQLQKFKKEKQESLAQMQTVNVLARDIKSGEIITTADFKPISVEKTQVPANAVTQFEEFSELAKCDSKGREIVREETQGANNTIQVGYSIVLEGNKKTKLQLDEKGQYYYQDPQTNQKTHITLSEKEIIAKIDLSANSFVTASNIAKGKFLADDERKQEYNVIALPTQIATGDYIDIRLRVPTGEDYIVATHKMVTVPDLAGVPSENCIWVQMSEIDTMNMSCAIVEAYRMEGAKLYATRYVEPGNQKEASITYLPTASVANLISKDPNVVSTASTALYDRMYKKDSNGQYIPTITDENRAVRNPIDRSKNGENAEDKLKEGVKSEIQSLQEQRQKYVESLGGTTN